MSFKIKLFLACLVSLAGAAQAQERAEPFVPGELIIGYNSPGDRDAAIGELNAPTRQLELRGRALESVQAQPMGENALKLRIEADGQITTRSAANPQAQLQALQDVARTIKERDSRVKYAHPNWLLTIKPPSQNQALDLKRLNTLDTRPKHQKPSLPNDPVFAQGLHWHYQPLPVGMNAVGAWRQAKGTREVTVAVLDTGVLPDHPDVKGSGNLLPGYNFVSIRGGRRGVGAADPGDACKPSDKPSWHGSHVAGTIGSVSSNNGKGMTGINWNVSVLPLRVLAACGGSIGDISDAIRWAAGLPVQGVDQVNAHPAQIINMSLGGPGSCTLDRVGLLIEAMEAARAAGSVIVVAAGNENLNISDTYPAGCKGVISVAASDRRGRLAYYSNHGDVTIMAPGGDIRVKDKAGFYPGVWSVVKVSAERKAGLEPMQGTSMAAPHVSGAIALAMAARPDWRGKPDLVEQKLRACAVKPLPGACGKPCGAGQLDAEKLLTCR